eukprot:EG_transcript_7670
MRAARGVGRRNSLLLFGIAVASLVFLGATWRPLSHARARYVPPPPPTNPQRRGEARSPAKLRQGLGPTPPHVGARSAAPRNHSAIAGPPAPVTISPRSSPGLGGSKANASFPEHFLELREVVRQPGRPRGQYAYVCVISNEKYLDGAVTMGWSLRKHSRLLQTGRADLVIIVNELLHSNSLALLAAVGWDYVKVLKTLSYLSPRSYFTYTFDKLYLFGLTQYRRVVFFDADMICTGSPDAMFNTSLPSARWVGAIGATGSAYFQTGTMVIQPSIEVFEDLYREYRYGKFNYNQWRARDGILCRNYFGTQHVMYPSAPLHHYSGYFKPWFNKDKPPARSEKYPDFGHYYQLWWKTYEEVHLTALISFWDGRSPYGGLRTLDSHVTPHTHLWLQRYAKMNYTRKLSRTIAQETNLTTPHLRLLPGTACDTACAAEGLACREDALQWWSVNGCPTLLEQFKCSKCAVAHNKDWTPGKERGECQTNFLHDVRFRPRCNASAPSPATRLCPCVPASELSVQPTLRAPLPSPPGLP